MITYITTEARYVLIRKVVTIFCMVESLTLVGRKHMFFVRKKYFSIISNWNDQLKKLIFK